MNNQKEIPETLVFISGSLVVFHRYKDGSVEHANCLSSNISEIVQWAEENKITLENLVAIDGQYFIGL